MSNTDLVACYLSLADLHRRTDQLVSAARDQHDAVVRVEREAERVLKNEEEARASYARRMQSRTEAKDRLARMEKYDPGVGFLGYQSPARRRLAEMRLAVKEHAAAAHVAQERRELAVASANRVRGELVAARARRNRWQEAQVGMTDPRALEVELASLNSRMATTLHALAEADIDGAVMTNRINEKEARRVRQALRSRGRVGLER